MDPKSSIRKKVILGFILMSVLISAVCSWVLIFDPLIARSHRISLARQFIEEMNNGNCNFAISLMEPHSRFYTPNNKRIDMNLPNYCNNYRFKILEITEVRENDIYVGIFPGQGKEVIFNGDFQYTENNSQVNYNQVIVYYDIINHEYRMDHWTIGNNELTEH